MNITVASTGELISGSQILSSTFRSDLVPIPATLELNVQGSDALAKVLVDGAELIIGEPALSMVIVKSLSLKTQVIKNSSRIGGIAIVAVLKGFERLMSRANGATILNQTTFGGALRAIGAKVRIQDDLPLPEFVCLKGQLATERMALYLQQEAAAIRLNTNGSISFLKLDTLMKGVPVAKYDSSSVTWVNNPKIEAQKKSSFYSVNADGSTIENENPSADRGLLYMPRLDTRQLKNLEKVLIHRGTIMRPLDSKLFAGNIVEIDKKKYVILTAAMRVDTGSLGGASVMASKAWLSSL